MRDAGEQEQGQVFTRVIQFQYPLYSASIALYGGSLVGYYLDEDNNWAMDIRQLELSLSNAR
jgi:aspartate/methionine/tyrosine aminotransferase